MIFQPPLKKATLIKRYKRFLADVILDDGSVTTMHVANTGAMTGCATPEDTVWYSNSDNPKRKYPFSWELTQTKQGGHFICVNTAKANHLVVEAIENGVIEPFHGFNNLKTEVKYGSENSRIDIFLNDSNNQPTYIEVKSVTLLQENMGYFPDAVTTRGQKHIRELMAMVEAGNRAILFFAVLHTGIETMSVADHIDPKYGELLRQAKSMGVEVLAYRATITSKTINLTQPIELLI